MRVCVTLEHRFFGTPDGLTWTVTQFPYPFFLNYLEVFDSVRVIARVFPVARAESNFQRADGPGVEFYPMPAYIGPFQFARHYREVKLAARDSVQRDDASILRVHSQVANSVERWLTERRQPFALEVVADPFDVLGPKANKHVVAPIARRYFARNLKSQCQRAVAVSYVTKESLQKRYPPAIACHPRSAPASKPLPDGGDDTSNQYSTSVSDVALTEECYGSTRPKKTTLPPGPSLVFLGTLESLYKGPDTLIRAVSLCRDYAHSVRLTLVGSGKELEGLRHLAAKLDIADRVTFAGSLTAGTRVREKLDEADVFVLCSRAEGLPRAMLEAMARGLPCIGSTVGGIPELLHQSELVPPDNPELLARKIIEVTSDEDRLARLSAGNLLKAKEYSSGVLSERRTEFYFAVKALTQAAARRAASQGRPPA